MIEKTESWPKVNMRFWRRHNVQRKKSKRERTHFLPCWMWEERYPSTRTRGRGSFSVSPEPLRGQPHSQLCPQSTRIEYSFCVPQTSWAGKQSQSLPKALNIGFIITTPSKPEQGPPGFGCQMTLPSLREGRIMAIFIWDGW